MNTQHIPQISKREYFAATVLSGLIVSHADIPLDDLVNDSVIVADQLIYSLNKQQHESSADNGMYEALKYLLDSEWAIHSNHENEVWQSIIEKAKYAIEKATSQAVATDVK